MHFYSFVLQHGRSAPINDLQRALKNISLYTIQAPAEEHDCSDHNIQLVCINVEKTRKSFFTYIIVEIIFNP